MTSEPIAAIMPATAGPAPVWSNQGRTTESRLSCVTLQADTPIPRTRAAVAQRTTMRWTWLTLGSTSPGMRARPTVSGRSYRPCHA
jgi:hypothetical protein